LIHGPSRSLRIAAALALVLSGGLSLGAQSSPISASEAEDGTKDENPLLRFEIVSLGSYPFSLLYVGFAADLARYYGNGRDPAYAPWPFNSSSSVSLDNAERMQRLEAALCVSFAVGLVDAFIHAQKVKKAKRLRAALLDAAAAESAPEGAAVTPAAPVAPVAPAAADVPAAPVAPPSPGSP